jgi:hypothetical protein
VAVSLIGGGNWSTRRNNRPAVGHSKREKTLLQTQTVQYFRPHPYSKKNKIKTQHNMCWTPLRKQIQITQIRYQPSYKQLEVKTNRTSFLCGNRFQLYFSYIVAVSLIGGGNRSIRRNKRPAVGHSKREENIATDTNCSICSSLPIFSCCPVSGQILLPWSVLIRCLGGGLGTVTNTQCVEINMTMTLSHIINVYNILL